jgi:hypothetical protein
MRKVDPESVFGTRGDAEPGCGEAEVEGMDKIRDSRLRGRTRQSGFEVYALYKIYKIAAANAHLKLRPGMAHQGEERRRGLPCPRLLSNNV